MKPIYLDHSATTPLSHRALEAMLPYFCEEFGNPSAIYSYGQEAHNVLEKCRNRMAKALGALSTEIFFTSGGTEGDNWILRGVARSRRDKGRHIISSEIEHNAVRRTLEQLEEDGYEVTYLKPNSYGHITPAQLEAAIRPDTILISIMLANNVVGTILDIPALTAIAKKHRILFHTDAVQAVGHIPLQVKKLGVDFLTLSAHKFGGPKGVGAVYCRLPLKPSSHMTGGGQEKTLRSGTENIPGIVGMITALEEALEGLESKAQRLSAMRDRLIRELTALDGLELTGDPANRLPGFASFVIRDIKHSVLLVGALNELGICVSSGSACSAASKEASHVLLALGYDKALASASLRLTLGDENTEEDVTRAITAIGEVILRLRSSTESKPPRLEGRVAEMGTAQV